MSKLIVDPPEGWRYGFPKECPEEIFNDEAKFHEWLLECGYPQSLIDLGHVRYWRQT